MRNSWAITWELYVKDKTRIITNGPRIYHEFNLWIIHGNSSTSEAAQPITC